jgi:hypothetical protein
MANVPTRLLEFFGHSWTSISAQAEPGLFLDMGQHDHVGPLPLTGGSAATGAQATFADIQNLTKAVGREFAAMLFPSRACKQALPGSE